MYNQIESTRYGRGRGRRYFRPPYYYPYSYRRYPYYYYRRYPYYGRNPYYNPYPYYYGRYPYYNPYPYYPRRRGRVYGMEVNDWDPESEYAGGDRVIYDGKMYQAKWWTQDENPSIYNENPWETPWREV
jgi:restriction endonuclease S subunit